MAFLNERVCERCAESFRVPGTSPSHRFCPPCRKAVIKELDEAGKLQKRVYGHVGQQRTAEQREDVRETKRGIDR